MSLLPISYFWRFRVIREIPTQLTIYTDSAKNVTVSKCKIGIYKCINNWKHLQNIIKNKEVTNKHPTHRA